MNPSNPEIQLHNGEVIKSVAPGYLFDAYVKGNAVIPQSNAAIEFFVTASVLEKLKNGAVEWQDLLQSELSPEQLTFAGKKLTHMHASLGVQSGTAAGIDSYSQALATAGVDNSEVKKFREIPEQEINRLWLAARNGAKRKLLGFANSVTKNKMQALTREAEVTRMREFYENSTKHQREKSNLTLVAETMIESLNSDPIKDMLVDYRSKVAKISQSAARAMLAMETMRNIGPLVAEYVQSKKFDISIEELKVIFQASLPEAALNL